MENETRSDLNIQRSSPEQSKTRINTTDHLPQFSLPMIAALWCAAALPMPILAFWAAPLLARQSEIHPGIVLWCCLIAGMVWQFVLAAFFLWREAKADGGKLSLRTRIWLKAPLNPGTERKNWRLILWVIPIAALTYLVEDTAIADALAGLMQWTQPWLAGMPAPDLRQLQDPALQGAWWLIPIAITSCLFNYVLGETLFFHGFLLPRMNGAFGRWDWLWNGVLFGTYHLIRPLTIPAIVVTAAIWAWPCTRYRSSIFAFVVHAVDGFFVIALTIAVVAGV